MPADSDAQRVIAGKIQKCRNKKRGVTAAF
jgi:hypothetical protein